MTEARLSIFARYPAPGRVKTRMIPALGADGAAHMYRRLLEHTIRIARESGLQFELRITGGPEDAFIRWIGPGFAYAEQGEGTLGDKLSRVPAPAILIGSDAPGLTAAILRQAKQIVAAGQVAIGPATDGGYYLLGLPRQMPFLFDAIPWSTSAVLAETTRQLVERHIPVAMLPEMTDIDEPADLAAWPAFLP